MKLLVADIVQFDWMNSRTFKDLWNEIQGLSSTCPVFKYFQGLEFRRKKFEYFQGLSVMRGNLDIAVTEVNFTEFTCFVQSTCLQSRVVLHYRGLVFVL